MRLGGRTQAAIEVLEDMARRKRPASEALRDWGLSHRFAGAGDRSAIGNLVYDSLRRKSSNAWLMESDAASANIFITLQRDWGISSEQMSQLFEEDKFAPEIPLMQLASSKKRDLAFAEAHIEADIPQWCVGSFEDNFEDEWVGEAKALAGRPPLDLRVNTLKAEQQKVLKALKQTNAKKTAIASNGLRIPPSSGARRLPNVQAEEGYQKGWFEIQDEGSQIVSELVFAKKGEQVLDYCAGGGGKTLALAALMKNAGQIHAYDADKNRLAPIYERIKRAGIHNVQTHQPGQAMESLKGKMDRVLVDAPCTGSGTWRRRPDAKWRLTPEMLEMRNNEQENVLDQAMAFVKPGGYLIYVTCSVFPEENEHQIYAFGERHNKDNQNWELLSAGEAWEELYGHEKPKPWSSDLNCFTLTPASTQTDGFFFAVIQRLN